MVAMALIFTGKPFLFVAKVIVIAQFPVMIIEGLITVFCVKFLKRVKPEILEVIYAP
jgi:cobalt/nickel transport system permease protein